MHTSKANQTIGTSLPIVLKKKRKIEEIESSHDLPSLKNLDTLQDIKNETKKIENGSGNMF